jgi:hypothetical protein
VKQPKTAEVKEVVQKVSKPQPAPKPKPSHQIGCENYRSLVTQYFGSKADTFLRIAHAESGCNPVAVGDRYPINGLYAPSCGLFQIRTLSGRPSCEALKDPTTNVQWAKRIYNSEGFGAWTVCRTKVSCY